MPSHIFTRLGLWDESIASNTDSRESARCYTQEMGIEGLNGSAIHAMDYLVYAYLQRGDNAGAREQHALLRDQHNPEAMNGHGSVYPAAAIPARIALENRDWAAAATLDPDELPVAWEKFPWERAILHYARAIGAARTGDLAAAKTEIAGLEQRHQQLREAEDPYLAAQVDVQLAAARAWHAYASGDRDGGLEQMRLAAELENQTAKHPVTPGEVLPAQELYGDMLLDAGQPAAALATFEASLRLRPGRFNGLYGAATAARAAGDLTKERQYLEQLLGLTAGVESDRPELAAARERLGAAAI
jgi:tetratricopeptide (TPR) repeat protein